METKYKVNGNKMGKLETKQKEHKENGGKGNNRKNGNKYKENGRKEIELITN